MIAGLLTIEQKNELIGQQFAPDSYFNPFEHEENWYISIEEIDQCTNENFIWVKSLPKKELTLTNDENGATE